MMLNKASHPTPIRLRLRVLVVADVRSDVEPLCLLLIFLPQKSQKCRRTGKDGLGRLMGHSFTRTTARYIRVSGEHHLKAVEKGAEHILGLMNKKTETTETAEAQDVRKCS
jgi:hypothetical protein